MSVIIQNMGLAGGKRGVFTYDVRINRALIARCHHRRTDGLATLLRIAADAVDAVDAAAAGGEVGGYNDGLVVPDPAEGVTMTQELAVVKRLKSEIAEQNKRIELLRDLCNERMYESGDMTEHIFRMTLVLRDIWESGLIPEGTTLSGRDLRAWIAESLRPNKSV